MIVVDTSAWIEWMSGGSTSPNLRGHWPSKLETVVPTLVQLELAKWLTREVSEEAADRAIAYTEQCQVVPLDTRLALRAAQVSRDCKLATADAIIYATALELGAGCLTCDSHFEGLTGVILLRKGL